MVLVYFTWGMTPYIWFSIFIPLALFLFFVKKHQAQSVRLKVEKKFRENCALELDYLQGTWRQKKDGRDFLDSSHPFANDLNVFGAHSLFQFLDRTQTEYARQRFADILKNPLTNPGAISKQKALLSELAADPEFVLRLISKTSFIDVDANYFIGIRDWVKHLLNLNQTWKKALLLYILPLITIGGTIAYNFDVLSGNQLMLLFFIPGLTVMSKLKSNQATFKLFVNLLDRTDAFESIIKDIRSKDFQSEALRQMVSDAELDRSAEGIAKLRKIVGAIENRNNVFVSILLNLYLLWDFRCLYRLDKWKKEYGTQLTSWLQICVELESHASLAIYVFNHPEYVYAELNNDDRFEIVEGRHVLMGKDAIANDLNLGVNRSFSIITGANMAGKSTYLRMIGTSQILAMSGAPVCAKSFSFQPKALFTSMLAADSLGDNESYFFNELKRLKNLVTKLEAGEPQFVILDEILKGTNSVDKAEGARKFLIKLLRLPAKGIVATHDLSLCELEAEYPDRLVNNKFEVGYNNDELVFAYKLEPGVCQNMNANFLLKKMGLVD